jgi:hypothetical protein
VVRLVHGQPVRARRLGAQLADGASRLVKKPGRCSTDRLDMA